MTAADALYEIMSIMVKKDPLNNMISGNEEIQELRAEHEL